MNYLLLETNFCSLCTVLDLIINGCCNICCFKFLLNTTKKHQRRHVGFIKNNKIGWRVVMWLIKTNDNWCLLLFLHFPALRSNILITLFLFNEIYCQSTPAATVYLSSSPLNQAHLVYFPNYRSSFHLCGLPLHYSTLEQETFSSLEISSSPLSPRIIWIYDVEHIHTRLV